jgi:hypothetical protein
VKSSYKVSALFAGGNVMNLTDEANRTLMVSEAGKRHPLGFSGTEGHYVYGDLHSSLGYTGPAMPGAWLRIWYSGVNTSYFAKPANNVGLTSAPKYEDSFYGGNWDFGITFYRNLIWGLLGTGGGGNDWWLDPTHGWYNWTAHEGRPRYPQNWLARVDALFKPPASGTWQFQVAGNCYQQVYFGVGSAVANPAQGFDQAPTVTMYRRDWWLQGGYWNDNSCSKQITGMDSGRYYPIVFFNNGCCWSGGDYVRARRMDAAGNVDANYSNVVLSSSNVCRIP